jgi:hypothetical protein
VVEWKDRIWKTLFRSKKVTLTIVVIVLALGFSPIARVLLWASSGSFAPTPYTSLSLNDATQATRGVVAGQVIRVKLTNRTGGEKTYHWSATQSGSLLSLGDQTLGAGQAATILVPSRGAAKGTLRIALAGTNIFLTVPVLKS